jgi:hypothetical protein
MAGASWSEEMEILDEIMIIAFIMALRQPL